MSDAIAEVRCAECGTVIPEGAPKRETNGGTFCETCFETLKVQAQGAVREQGENINFPLAVLGGLGGGVLGAGAWWGFTVMTEIAFGLVAIVIGFAVGKGVVLATGKRAVSLQIISVAIASVSFFAATYLVNRSFIVGSAEMEAAGMTLPLLPSPALAYEVIAAGFSPMDLVFLGIVVWEAWRAPAPIKL